MLTSFLSLFLSFLDENPQPHKHLDSEFMFLCSWCPWLCLSERFEKCHFPSSVFSPLSRWLTDGLADLNIGSGVGEQDHAAAVEVMGVLSFLLAALSASVIETASSAMLLQADAWARGLAGASYLPFQSYHPYSGSAGGVVLELAVVDGLSGQGRAEGWDISSCWRGRLGAAQFL